MVERSVTENPQIAKVGGIPSVFHKFRGYINVKLANNKDLPEWDLKNFDYVSDVPCWAIIFYLLRAGFLEEADEFVRQNQQSFQKLDRSFPTYLHAYCSAGDERRLPRNLLDRIQGEYNNRVRHSEDTKDIFKPAVYKIIGRCDLSKRSVPNVMPTAEDWMWLQLVLAREIDKTTEPAHEVFTLTDLQKGVLQFGAKHFSQKGSNVGLYFQMLMMSGLFEDVSDLCLQPFSSENITNKNLGCPLFVFIPIRGWCSFCNCAHILWSPKTNFEPRKCGWRIA